MGRNLYVYLNNSDILLIQQMLTAEQISFFDRNGMVLQSVPAITQTVEEYTVGSPERHLVVYSPCWGTFLQPAHFYEDCNSPSREYKIIKRIVQSKCNKTSWFYYGTGIYKDWCRHIFEMPWLERQVFTIEGEKIHEFWKIIDSFGYIIKNNIVEISRKDIFNDRGDSFVIYKKGANIINKTILIGQYGVEIIDYAGESDCLFVSKKRSQYSFILDQRKKNDAHCSCVEVFDSLSAVAKRLNEKNGVE